MESVEKTRARYGVRAKLSKGPYRRAASAAAVTVLSFIYALGLLLEYAPFELPYHFLDLFFFDVLVAPAIFAGLFFVFIWKRDAAKVAVDRGIYVYRLFVFPADVFIFPVFRYETALEKKLRLTAKKRRRVERKRVARRHREFLRDNG